MAIVSGRRVNDDFLRVIGGPSAENVLEGRDGGVDGYWPRVWAVRGLLHVWDDVATDAIIDATTHEAWRVREVAATVIARHHVRQAIDAVVMLLDDENARGANGGEQGFSRRRRVVDSTATVVVR